VDFEKVVVTKSPPYKKRAISGISEMKFKFMLP